MSDSAEPTPEGPGRWILELVLLFGVPAIAFCVGLSLESWFGSSLRSSRQRHAQLVLADLQRGYATHPTDEERDRVQSLRMRVWLADRTSTGALWAFGIGASLIAGMEAAGWCARRCRWMLALFAPCLFGMALTLAVLLVLHAALACLCIYFLNNLYIYLLDLALGGDVVSLYPVLLILIGGGALLLSVPVFLGTLGAGRPPALKKLGRSVTEEEAPQLWSAARDLARESGAKPPTAIVVGLDPNIFVTEAPVEHLKGVARGRVLYFSLPLYRAMTFLELRVILLNELACFGSGATIAARRVFRIARDTPEETGGRSLDGVFRVPSGTAARTGGAPDSVLLPSVLQRCLDGFLVPALATIRARAKAADEAAARDVGPVIFASALLKKHLYRGLDYEVWWRVARVLRSGQVLGNVSDFRTQLAFKKFTTAWAGGYKTLPPERGPVPVDPLPDRLSRLGVSIDDLDLRAVFGPPAEDASALVGDLERLETEMSMEYQREVAWQFNMSWPPNPPARQPAEAVRAG